MHWYHSTYHSIQISVVKYDSAVLYQFLFFLNKLFGRSEKKISTSAFFGTSTVPVRYCTCE